MPGGQPLNTLLTNSSPVAYHTRQRQASGENGVFISHHLVGHKQFPHQGAVPVKGEHTASSNSDTEEAIPDPVTHNSKVNQQEVATEQSLPASGVENTQDIPVHTSASETDNLVIMAHPYGPKFTGKDDSICADDWIEDLLKVMEMNNVADAKKVMHLEFQLDGFARTWFRGLSANKKDTLAHAVAAFKEAFQLSATKKSEVRSQLHRLQQPSNITGRAYAQQIIHMAHPLGMSDGDVLDIIKASLHPSIRLLVQMSNPKSLDELMRNPACESLPTDPAVTSITTAPPSNEVNLCEDNMDRLVYKFASAMTGVNATKPTHPTRPSNMDQHIPHHQEGPPYHRNSSNAHHRPSSQARKPCRGCGKFIPLYKSRCFNCPASYRPCEYCGVLGHFVDVCFKRKHGSKTFRPNNSYRY